MRVVAPCGYRFEVSPKRNLNEQLGKFTITVSLLKKRHRKIVGWVDLQCIDRKANESFDRAKHTTFETHSYLDEDLHGEGIGSLMYLKAINVGHSRGFNVCSSNAPSDNAQRIWRGTTLRKYYRIVKRSRRWCVYKL